jgi:hypothetical protein
MILTIIFEILLLFTHSTNPFKIVNGINEDIASLSGGSVTINVEADSWFYSCSLKINGVQICQMTWERRNLHSRYYEKMSCTSKFNHVKYVGNGSSYDCKFVVPNLQENGNNLKFLLCLSNSIITFLHIINFVIL